MTDSLKFWNDPIDTFYDSAMQAGMEAEQMKPQSAAWVQSWQIVPCSNQQWCIDRVIESCAGKFTDLLLGVLHLTGGDSDGACLGYSGHYHQRPERINGLTMLEYFTQQAHAAGMRVHGWHVVGLFGGHRGLVDPLPDEWNLKGGCGDRSWVDFRREEARQRIADAIMDIQRLNKLDGVHLDYIRYHLSAHGCAGLHADQITDIVERVRAGLPAGQDVSVAFLGDAPDAYGGSKSSNTYQDIDGWLDRGLVDFACRMRYHDDPSAVAAPNVESCPNSHLILPGVSAEPAVYDDPDTAAAFIKQVKEWKALGYTELSYFDHGRLDDLPIEAWAVIPDVQPVAQEPEPPAEPEPGTITMPIGDYNSIILSRDRARQQVQAIGEELARLRQMVNELQAGMEGEG
jgi:hypothetical protein